MEKGRHGEAEAEINKEEESKNLIISALSLLLCSVVAFHLTISPVIHIPTFKRGDHRSRMATRGK